MQHLLLRTGERTPNRECLAAGVGRCQQALFAQTLAQSLISNRQSFSGILPGDLSHLESRCRLDVDVGSIRPADKPSLRLPVSGVPPPEEDLITDKQMLRDAPPDILITNYKMLDYLLVRPRDARLWRRNEPGTLRYLVVDELHAFDGAQGADLACLVRRIKERVKTPEDHLCCVGTSATLGEGSQADLAAYAREVFGEPFDGDSVIGESLLTTDEFLKGCLVTRFQTPGTGDLGTMDPLAHESAEDYVRAQSTLWMGADLSQDPVALAEALKHHAFFRNLLTILGNRAVAAGDLAAELKKQLPGFGGLEDAYLDRLLVVFWRSCRGRESWDPSSKGSRNTIRWCR